MNIQSRSGSTGISLEKNNQPTQKKENSSALL